MRYVSPQPIINADSNTIKYKVPNHSPNLTLCEEEYLVEAFRSGWISSKGAFIQRFEKTLCEYVGKQYACVVSSGTAALHLALKALNIGPGDEVIIPNLTYIAVANAVLYCGAIPVLTDVHPDYWCLDPDRIADSISEKTKAIIAVHGFGHPVDMDRIISIANQYQIPIIEDAAQAFGARYKGRVVGSMGQISIHSFYTNKIITTGEGGAIITDDPAIKAKVSLLINHCESADMKFFHVSTGYNYRITNLQAAIGYAQMERLNQILELRNNILSWYREELADIPFITINPSQGWAVPVNWQVCIKIEKRPQDYVLSLKNHLEQSGIEIRPSFIPLCNQPSLADISRNCSSAVSLYLCNNILMLPSGNNLNRDDVRDICKKIKNWRT